METIKFLGVLLIFSLNISLSTAQDSSKISHIKKTTTTENQLIQTEDKKASSAPIKSEQKKKFFDLSVLPETVTDEFGIDYILLKPGYFNFENASEEIRYPFYLQKTEMTQAQWKQIMGSESWKETEEFKSVPCKLGQSLPVVHVNYADVQKFVAVINSKAKNPVYRLPTQEEIAYASVAGSEMVSAVREQVSPYCWNYTNSVKMMRVGLKMANAWGFYDLNGNVWEWTMDREDRIDKILPKTFKNGELTSRMKHGGSYMSDWTECLPTYQQAAYLDERSSDLGFRLLKYVVE